MFFAQKVLCKLAGNGTFVVVVADLLKLEAQIAETLEAAIQ